MYVGPDRPDRDRQTQIKPLLLVWNGPDQLARPVDSCHERGKGIGGFNNKDIGVTLTFNIDVSSFANSLNEQIQACPGGVTLKIQLSERMMSKIAHG